MYLNCVIYIPLILQLVNFCFDTLITSFVVSAVQFRMVRCEINVRKINFEGPKCIELTTGMLQQGVAGFHKNVEFLNQLNVLENCVTEVVN